MSGLRLDTKDAALAGGYSGPVIKPGNSAESKLIHLVAGLRKDLVMPMGGERLTADQVGMLRAWIDQGAQWAEAGVATAEERVPAAKETAAKAPPPEVKTTHWAFVPPRRLRPPQGEEASLGSQPH